MIRVLLGVVLVSIACVLGIALTRAWAQDRPYADLLLAVSDDCAAPAPCWQGVRPGFDYGSAFDKAIAVTPRYSGIAITNNNDVIREIRLQMRGDIRLGDVMGIWGSPSHANLSWVASTVIGARGRSVYVGATLYFWDGLVRVETLTEQCRWAYSPDMIVRRITYYAPVAVANAIPIGTPRWEGFRTFPLPTPSPC